MDSGRARSILQAVDEHRDPSATTEERAVIVGQGLLDAVEAATKDAWTQRVAGLPAVRDRVREASRIALATPGPTAPPDLQAMIGDLEELTREKASLDSLVWNGPTQEYLRPTLLGKSTLEDLTTWSSRLAGRSFDELRSALVEYRQGLVGTVGLANAVYQGLVLAEQTHDEGDVSFTQPYTNVDLRFAATILAKRALDPYVLVRTFEFYNEETNWGTWNKDDRLIGAVVLASVPGEIYPNRVSFENLRTQLAAHGVMPEDRIIVAASLADLDPSWWPQVFSRLDDLRRARPALNTLLASALARSPYTVDEALGRFDEAQAGMTARGFRDGISFEAAAAILASAQVPRAAMVDRFAFTAAHLAGAFDPTFAPAAIVAASPLEPAEAVDVFRDCIGTVTRSNFFDLTLEIEDLALVMSYGVAPLGLGYLAANLPPGVVPQAPAVAAAAPFVAPYWYAWHNYWVYRPLGRYIATHPVHVHTVAAFG